MLRADDLNTDAVDNLWRRESNISLVTTAATFGFDSQSERLSRSVQVLVFISVYFVRSVFPAGSRLPVVSYDRLACDTWLMNAYTVKIAFRV